MDEKDRINEYLSLLGLDQDEIAIYLTLVSRGAMTLSELSRTSGVERTALYRMIEKLQHKGIINIQEESKRKIIYPGSLDHLVKGEEIRVTHLKTRQSEISQLVQSLSGQQAVTNVRFYHGIEGIKQAIWNNLEQQRQDIYGLAQSSSGIMADQLFIKDYNLRLSQHKAQHYIASQEDLEQTHSNITYLYIPSNRFDIGKDFDVFEDTTIYYGFNDTPYAVEIRDKNIANINRQLIKLLFKTHQ